MKIRMKPKAQVGLDFDNTIVIYDRLFSSFGQEAGFLPAGFIGSKDQARAHIRALPDGETKWTKLQSVVYGPGIAHAPIAPGLTDFIKSCQIHHCDIFIVSHKTEYAAADPEGCNLRDAAWSWMKAQNLAGTTTAPVLAQNIYFESTRHEKLARIDRLGCDYFIDDLEEVFIEPTFPKTTERHLIKIGAETLPSGPFIAWSSWADLQRHFFDDD